LVNELNMETLKRLEIVVGSRFAQEVIDLLDSKNVNGYTTINRVAGKGSSGIKSADGMYKAFQNTYFIIFNSADTLEKLRIPLAQLLKDVGGNAWMSDAESFV